MKRLLIAGLALALLVPAFALAQSAFNGTWKTDVSSIKSSGEPLVIHLKDGTYETNSHPPIKIKADGADHAVTGHPGFDAVAVEVINDHSIKQTEKKDGKVVAEVTVTVTPDGKTANYEFTDYTSTGTTNGKGVAERVAKGAPGSNAVAGTWKFGHIENISANGLTATYKVDGDDISFSTPTGSAYTAKINGKAVPFTNGRGESGVTVAVKRMGKDSLRETWYRDGKETSYDTMTVAADGKTMKSTNHDLVNRTHGSSMAEKQ
ncbi:MAG: hypothetical protein JSR56_03585 [Proteobacteria bacterium]|nr:hypothetical protein [Pseudomonadota bacterium]